MKNYTKIKISINFKKVIIEGRYSMQRNIISLATEDGNFIVDAPVVDNSLNCNGMVVDKISIQRDQLVGVTLGAPKPFMYKIKFVVDTERCVYMCIPFERVRQIMFVETEKQEKQDEQPVMLKVT